jgi:hypothetical protein
MVWLRKGLVHFLAFILFLALLGGVWSIGINRNFGNPERVKTLLAESKVYDKAVSAVLNSAQKDAEQNGTATDISLSNPAVQDAAQKAFSPQLLQNSVNTFIDANYTWLRGKTSTPQFNIDLSAAKQDFAKRVGDYVQTRLSTLPACTPAQQAALQIPVDSMSVTCRPANLDPKTEGARVASEVGTSDFLSKPVITPTSLGRDQNSQSKPYFVQASKLPKVYRLAQKAPIILGIVALVSALLIVVIAPERRRGWRRVGAVLLAAGIILIASKFIADAGVHRLEQTKAHNTITSQLQQPRNDVLNKAESELVQANLYAGIAFIVLAAVVFFVLYQTREGKPRKSVVTEVPAPKSDETKDQPTQANDLRLAPRRPTGTTDTPTGPPALGPTPPKKKPPRLIQ